MDEAEIAALMEKYRQPAIMLHRPYPPVNLPPCRSQLGGRPSLPAGFDWPRTSKGIPLHFLAQINCAELPSTGGVLPASGALFFFARIDQDMLWGKGDPRDDCRVLFAPGIGTTEAEPPADLPELERSGPVVDFKLPGDPQVNVYPRWPVTLYGINSWPDMSAIPSFWEKDLKGYDAAVRRARAAEVVRVLGLPPGTGLLPSWGQETPGEAGGVTLPTARGDKPFPEAWIMADRIARYLYKHADPGAPRWRATRPPAPELLSRMKQEAAEWARLAAERGLDEATGQDAAKGFANWLSDLAREQSVRSLIGLAVRVGMKSAVQYAADSPRAAALIPPRYYNELENDHIPARASKIGALVANNPWQLSGSYHQMLGNTGSSQEARSVDRKEILLLQLKSDYGVNFLFCDAGEAEFWIDKGDLAARRFDKVFATTFGG